jgi:hypothetical protein
MPAKTKHIPTPGKWSAKVTKESDALNLEKDIFKSGDPDK